MASAIAAAMGKRYWGRRHPLFTPGLITARSYAISPGFATLPARREAQHSDLECGDRHLGKRGEHVINFARDRLKPLFALCLEARHENGLGVRRPDEAPTVAELDPHPVHVDDVVRGRELLANRNHDR